MKWHNAKKEQPKANGYYICTLEIDYIGAAKLDKKRYEIGMVEYSKNRYKENKGWYSFYSVIAWMELPKPYKEKL